MFGTHAPAVARRSGWIVGGLMLAMLSATPAVAQVSEPRTFDNDGGLVLHFIKPEAAADFEATMARLREALAKSDKPERRQQAAGWKVFKAVEPAGANLLYVFVIDPSVRGADYQVGNLIAEVFPPAEATEILTKYAAAYAQGMNVVNLQVLQDFGN